MRSDNVELQDDNCCAVIPANKYNNIAFVSQPAPSSSMNLRLQVDFSSTGEPVIGFCVTNLIDCNYINFDDNAQFSILWLLSQRILLIKGTISEVQMPCCTSGAIVEVISMERFNVLFKVLNPGKSVETANLVIAQLPMELFLFVGAIRTGNKFMSFQLMGRVTEERKETPFVDVSDEVCAIKSFGNMHVSHNGKVYKRTSTEQGNSCALLSRKIMSGRHTWSLRVLCDFGASLCVGLARYPFKLSEDYIKDPLKHIYRHPGLLLYRSYRGLLYIDGRQLERTLPPLGWQHNSIVTVTLDVDMEKRTVEILRNGKSIGVAFTEITGPLQGVICFYASYEKEIELISYKTTELSSSSLERHSPSVVHELPQTTPAPTMPKKITFDPRNKYGSLTLSSDFTSISREKSQSGNAYCLMNAECRAVGVYRFSYVIETDQGASVCIGVTDAVDPAAIRKVEIGNIYLSPSFYLYRSFQGMLYFKGRELTKRFDEFWMSGTLVEMTIDIASNEAVVQYTVNGKDQGIAFAGLKPPLWPVVAIYAGMEKRVTLIHFEHIPKRATVPIPTVSGQNNVNTSETHASKPSLPLLASPRNAEQPSSRECMVCGKPADTILLPCLHSIFCAEDSSRTTHCIICNQRVDSVWNILTER